MQLFLNYQERVNKDVSKTEPDKTEPDQQSENTESREKEKEDTKVLLEIQKTQQKQLQDLQKQVCQIQLN